MGRRRVRSRRRGGVVPDGTGEPRRPQPVAEPVAVADARGAAGSGHRARPLARLHRAAGGTHRAAASRRGSRVVIRFESVPVTYRDAPAPTLDRVDLVIPEGELCVVTGTTGTGKTTLLRAINGLVPHFTGGTLSGRVVVDGRDTRGHPPRDLAAPLGVVGADPLSSFVTDVVEDELAYGMESLGPAPDVMRTRVEETLDLL